MTITRIQKSTNQRMMELRKRVAAICEEYEDEDFGTLFVIQDQNVSELLVSVHGCIACFIHLLNTFAAEHKIKHLHDEDETVN
jgi:hypothetical protein